jgi:hypothetical protein
MKKNKNKGKESIVEKLRKDIKNFLRAESVESLYISRSGIKFEKKSINKFTQEELYQAAKKMPKQKRAIIEDFIKFLLSQKGLYASRPDYVNIRFNVEKKHIDKIAHLIKDGYFPSFRSFIIGKLKERFGLEKDFSKFFVKVKNFSSEFKSNQLLLPSEMFYQIWKRLEDEKSCKLTKSQVRKIISSEIENILNEFGN